MQEHGGSFRRAGFQFSDYAGRCLKGEYVYVCVCVRGKAKQSYPPSTFSLANKMMEEAWNGERDTTQLAESKKECVKQAVTETES